MPRSAMPNRSTSTTALAAPGAELPPATVPRGRNALHRGRIVEDIARALAARQAVTALEPAAAAGWVAGSARSAWVLARLAESDPDVLAIMERLAADAPAVVDQLPAVDQARARAQITAAGLEMGVVSRQQADQERRGPKC